MLSIMGSVLPSRSYLLHQSPILHRMGDFFALMQVGEFCPLGCMWPVDRQYR
jgi:hypothetical protein